MRITAVSVNQLLHLAQRQPVLLVEPSPWLRFKLNVVAQLYPSVEAFRLALNRETPLPEQPLVILVKDETEMRRLGIPFPVLRCEYDPSADRDLDALFVRNYHRLLQEKGVHKQSDFCSLVQGWVAEFQPRLVVVLLIDGLSLQDYPGDDASPCFVDGLSTTAPSMKRLIGDPPLASRLFEMGYTERYGFSYWQRSNSLTDSLFLGFTAGQLLKMERFQDVLHALEVQDLGRSKTYIQIVRSGLDEYAHGHRDEPPIKQLAVALHSDVLRLKDLLDKTSCSYLLVVTSDHGILWAHDMPQHRTVFDDGGPIRYYTETETICSEALSVGLWMPREQAFVLPVTHYRRELSATEWGSHGGVSRQECIVPLLRFVRT